MKKKGADTRRIRGKWYEAGKHMCSKTRKGGGHKRNVGKGHKKASTCVQRQEKAADGGRNGGKRVMERG